MAGRAHDGEIEVIPGGTKGTPSIMTKSREYRDQVRRAAAKLYGQGFERKHISKVLVDYLVPNKYFEDGLERPMEQRISQARARLKTWERDPKFRDLIWELAVVKLDLQTPAILDGISKKAKRGRIDAAKLALEITGRHVTKGDAAPTTVNLVIEGIPRPQRMAAGDADGKGIEIVDGEVMAEEDEDV